MAETTGQSLLSTAKASDSPFSVKLHPLVLLTITDFITRHTLTERTGPILGAVIGQQKGREVTLEHAFECATTSKAGEDSRDRIILEEPWFGERLGQYKEVHKEPPLELTAAFTLGSSKGPVSEHVPIVQQLKADYNDDILLILFNPEAVLDGSLTGGKLPITIFESFYEPGTEDGDKGLQVDDWGQGRQLQLKFRQIPFEVETDEAEMISVDYVAKGAANASLAVDAARKPSVAPSSKGKGKEKAVVVSDDEPEHTLSAEDEELIASLTSKSNAIKMLQSRVGLIRSYLTSLPPSYLTDGSLPPSAETHLDHSLLRQISSLLSRLPLLDPSAALPQTNGSPIPNKPSASPLPAYAGSGGDSAEKDEVALTNLLAQLTKTVGSAREMTQKANVVNAAKDHRRAVGSAREQVDGPLGSFNGGSMGDRRGPRQGGFEEYEGGFDSGADGIDGEL